MDDSYEIHIVAPDDVLDTISGNGSGTGPMPVADYRIRDAPSAQRTFGMSSTSDFLVERAGLSGHKWAPCGDVPLEAGVVEDRA